MSAGDSVGSMVSVSRGDTPLDFSPFSEEHAIPLSTATELLEYLAGIGVRLAVDGDRLDVDAPAGAITAELREELGARKQELVALLSGAPATRACVQGSAPTAPNRPASNDRGPECATLPTARGNLKRHGRRVNRRPLESRPASFRRPRCATNAEAPK